MSENVAQHKPMYETIPLTIVIFFLPELLWIDYHVSVFDSSTSLAVSFPIPKISLDEVVSNLAKRIERIERRLLANEMKRQEDEEAKGLSE